MIETDLFFDITSVFQRNMAVAPICFKMYYKDQTLNKGCLIPCTIDHKVLNHRLKDSYVCYNDVGTSMNPNKIMLNYANRLRYISANASEREKPSTFTSRSSSKEKQLESLDSYFGKFKEDRNEYSSNSLNSDLITSPNKEQISHPKKYLVKNGQAEVDDRGGSKSNYDDSSGLYIM